MDQSAMRLSAMRLDRRKFLTVGSLAAATILNRNVRADEALIDDTSKGLILRDKSPLNLEGPFSSFDSFVTPTHHFFVRNHFPIPQLSIDQWSLTVDGAVERPLSFSYDDLRNLPSKTMPLLLECAGNGRAHLVPKVKGLLWQSGAVGTAEWTGVPLADVLEAAGVKNDAVEVILQGADSGTLNGEPKSPGIIPFERSLPLEKARQPEVLLAYRMNGQELTAEHGYPVRAVVGGWYGMASVKWLQRITVISRPFQGFWQTLEYSHWQQKEGHLTLVPVTEIQVKSQIARPALRANIPAGQPYRITGSAWAGAAKIAKVEVSTDGGTTWENARLQGNSVAFAWQWWEYEWNVPMTSGRRTLMARATDTEGHSQPMTHDRHRRNYIVNLVVPVEVQVI